MRFTLSSLALLFVLAACNDQSPEPVGDTPAINDTVIADEGVEVEQEPAPVGAKAASVFPELFQYFSAQDSAFRPDGFEAFGVEKDTTALWPLDREALRPFLPYLVYNRDSSMAIDYVSPNFVLRKRGGVQQLAFGGPDTEVQLIDFKKGTRRRILFLGTLGYVCDAAWLDANHLLIAGAEGAEDKIIPLLWRYDVQANTIEPMRYRHPLNIEVTDYAEKDLNSKTVKTSPAF